MISIQIEISLPDALSAAQVYTYSNYSAFLQATPRQIASDAHRNGDHQLVRAHKYIPAGTADQIVMLFLMAGDQTGEDPA